MNPNPLTQAQMCDMYHMMLDDSQKQLRDTQEENNTLRNRIDHAVEILIGG